MIEWELPESPPSVAGVPPGSVVLDNLTLQSAFRALSIPKDGELPPDTMLAHNRGSGEKWNYKLNADFRLAIDIACLGQLLQALLINEKIVVDPAFMFRWNAQSKFISAQSATVMLPDIAKDLEEIIIPFQYEDDLHLALLAEASENALNYSKTSDFRKYLQTLALRGVQGAVLDITNGYFRTGYSDTSSLPIFNFGHGIDDPFYDVVANAGSYRIRDHVARLIRPFRIGKYVSEGSAGAEHSAGRLSGLVSAVRMLQRPTAKEFAILHRLVNFINALEAEHSDSHTLMTTPFARSDAYDKLSGSADVVKHVAATLYTLKLALLADASYMPHPLRNSFAVFDNVFTPDNSFTVPLDTSKLSPDRAMRSCVVELAEAIQRGRVADLARIGLVFDDVKIPFALPAVLQVSNDPAAILRHAMEMRESKAGRRLRRWFTDLHEEIASGNTKLREHECTKDELERLIRHWQDASPSDSANEGMPISLGVNIGMVALSTNQNLRLSSKPVMLRWQLRFLHDLTRIGHATPHMDRLIGSVFGSEVGRSWNRAQRVMVSFTTPTSTEKHRGLLDHR